MKRSIDKSVLPLLMAALAFAACDDSTGVGTTTSLTVLLTDAPSDYIDEAMVDIGAVELLGGASGPVMLTEEGTDGLVNLLDLRNAATTALAELDIEAGTYTQLRLIVQDANVSLAPGYEFNDGSTSAELTVPSGAQTGIKLNLRAASEDGTEGGVEIAPGEMVLVVDFDVDRSFVLQGNPETAAGINSVSFRPTLRVIVRDVAGSVSGTVSTSLVGASVQGLMVTATPVEDTVLEPFQSSTASAVTDAEGNYTIHFLVPGEYDVTVATDDAVSPETINVLVRESEEITGIDFEVVAG